MDPHKQPYMYTDFYARNVSCSILSILCAFGINTYIDPVFKLRI